MKSEDARVLLREKVAAEDRPGTESIAAIREKVSK